MNIMACFVLLLSFVADRTAVGDSYGVATLEPPEANSSTFSNDSAVVSGLADEGSPCERMPEKIQLWSKICEGFISLLIGIFGLLGNLVTVIILNRPTFQETFHKLLICLSAFDSLFIGK